jgi:membrane associated rhomboid family serine protease
MVSRRSPTLTLAAALVAVFALQVVGGFLGLFAGLGGGSFALSPPLGTDPWTLVTSVFTHGGLGHLLSNLVVLLVVGLLLERSTSNARFLVFFVVAGVVSGVAEVGIGWLVFGDPTPVWGASGAIFALGGYLLAGNRLTDRVLGGVNVSTRTQAALFLAFAALLTLVTGGRRVALIAHFSGLLFGLLAGRAHVLRTDTADPEPADPEPW